MVTNQNRPPPGPAIVKQVRKETCGTCLVGFSGGKDSVVTALAVRDVFEVIPFSLYLIPDLEFVEESLTYYEKTLFRGQHIIRMPHPGFYQWLNTCAYQSPSRKPVIEAARLPDFEFGDVQDLIRDQYKCQKAYTAVGVRAADSPMRHVSIMQHGAISHNKKEFYPVWDMKKEELLKTIENSGVKLSVDYKIFGRSFDGLDCRFLIPLRNNFPRDYQKILEWFPLVEAEVFRFEKIQQG